MPRIEYIELKLIGGNKIAKAKLEDNKVHETPTLFFITIEGELKMKEQSKKEWDRVVWRKENEIRWTSFFLPRSNNNNVTFDDITLDFYHNDTEMWGSWLSSYFNRERETNSMA